ncbi:MAG: NAD(P)H-dependent oxidoreductase [Ilumatobacteraceae bacterium]
MSTVLTVCGSLGDASANRAALRVVQQALVQLGASVVDDAQLPRIPPLDPGLVDSPAHSVAAFRRQIGEADAVIIAAPEYAGSLAGSVKNALDWVVGSGELYERPVGILSAGTSGGPFARQVLAQTLLWQGAYLVAQLGIAAPRTKIGLDGSFDDVATIDALRAFAASVAAAASAPADELAARSTAVAASVGVRREADVSRIRPSAGFG